MTDYEKRLLELAKEIHELQLAETQIQSKNEVGIKTDWLTIRLNSKINFLIGYIMALENEEAK